MDLDGGESPLDVLREVFVGMVLRDLAYGHEDDERLQKLPAEITGVRLGTDADRDPVVFFVLDGGIGRGGR